jgi:hypothetical protein
VITRNSLIGFLVLAAGLAIGFLASKGLIGFLAISHHEKDLSELTRIHPAPDSGVVEMPLRIVDLGGVGVLPDTAKWGGNYEHNQHFFEDVMLVNPPFIDTAAFEREKRKLADYAGRMGSFGYNAIAIPWFLEYINFDRVGNGRQVYGDEDIYRMRHDSLASRFGELMALSADKGLRTYLWTDMVALTPPLKSYLLDRFGSMDTEKPEFWEIYGKAAEEAFEKFPLVDGIIIRIGEAGSIYNKPGWDYTSELCVKTEKAVQLMLGAFLEAAEKYNRTIIFRTWSVGVGKIGDMHTNPVTYQRVLGGIESDHLVVSTKYCSGDFYSWLPFNPTLYQGEQRRIVELQAKREYEGFGAIPNFVGPLHQSALQSILEKNPRLEGVWVWTQYGGPLRAGPLIIYPFYGFNVINDVNVYVASRLMMDPYADLDSITGRWIAATFGTDSLLVNNLVEFLDSSYPVMLRGLYISEFARYDVRALGLEPPPMLWIFEWNILGASSSVFSNIYFITRDHFQQVIDEGFDGVKAAMGLKEMLLGVKERVTLHQEEFDRLVASVDYEIDLFRLLGYYRQFFMNYYRWIDTGQAQSDTDYKLAMGQFKAVVAYHEEKYGDDLNTLGMDFEEAIAGVRLAEHTGMAIRWARVAVVFALFLLVMGIPGFVRDRAHRKFAGTLYFDAIFRPRWISDLQSYHGTRMLLLFMGSLYILAFVIFSSFTSLLFPLAFGLLGLLFVILLSILVHSPRNLDKIMLGLMAPKVFTMILFLVIVAIRGPLYFWYQFWVSDLFKMIFLSVYFLLLFRKFHIYLIICRKWGHLNGYGSVALVLAALGYQILVAGLALQFFGLEESLTALNNELLLLPGGLSKIMGITTHLGIPLQLPLWIIAFGSALAVASTLLLFFNYRLRRKRRRVNA